MAARAAAACPPRVGEASSVDPPKKLLGHQVTLSPVRVQRVAFYPADCTGDKCSIDQKPSFLADFKSRKFMQDGRWAKVSDATVCGEKTGDDVMFRQIYRNAYPVYVKPSNVKCDRQDGITMKMMPN